MKNKDVLLVDYHIGYLTDSMKKIISHSENFLSGLITENGMVDLVKKTYFGAKKVCNSSNISIDKAFDRLFNSYVNDIIKDYFERGEGYEVMKTFLAKEIIKDDDYVMTVGDFNRFCNFVTKYNYHPSFEEYKSLIDVYPQFNAIFKNYLKLNLDKDLVNDDIFFEMFDVYGVINDLFATRVWDDLNTNDNEIDLKDELINIYLQELNFDLLSAEEEKRLAILTKNGDREARQKMIEHNLRYVVHIAKRYRFIGLPFGDLIEDGNMGLIKAVDRFDANKGFRFTTYATWWINAAIRRYISYNYSNFKIPKNIFSKYVKLQYISYQLAQQIGHFPTDEELSEAMILPIDQIQKLKNTIVKSVSLHEPIFDDDEEELIDIIADENDKSDEEFNNVGLSDATEKIFSSFGLTEKEKYVLARHTGMFGYEAETLEQIGASLNVTRKRVHQIREKALYKIRNSELSNEFAVYMDNPDQALQNKNELVEKYNDQVKRIRIRQISYNKKIK